jgi:pimeloyl-ACP methyl ester carboxylesterase
MALTMADRIDRLVLLSPVLPDRPWEPGFMASLKEVARTVRSDGVTAAMLGPWMSSPLWSGEPTPRVRQKLEVILRDFPGADYLAAERDSVDRPWSVPERLGEIDAPTLVVVGEREMAGFREFAHEIAGGIPGATIEILTGQGHLHPLEASDRVGARIIDHLTD